MIVRISIFEPSKYVKHWLLRVPPTSFARPHPQRTYFQCSALAQPPVRGTESIAIQKDEHKAEDTSSRRTPGVPLLHVSSTNLNDFVLPTAPHRSLSSFLHYARQNAVSRTSTVYTGTLYEYLILDKLRGLGFDLVRVGGAGDAGIDLLGYWHLPTRAEPFKVLVQCKRLSKSGQVKPSMVRELEAVFGGAPVLWRAGDTIGVLVVTKSATKGIRDAMGRSRRPFVWIMVEETEHNTDSANPAQGTEHEAEPELPVPQCVVKQILWNQSAAAIGFEGMNVVPKYQTSGIQHQTSKEAPSATQVEVGLMWNNQFVPPMDAIKHLNT